MNAIQKQKTPTITLDQFKALIARDDWKHEQDIEIQYEGTYPKYVNSLLDHSFDAIDMIEIETTQGAAWIDSELDGVTIHYGEQFSFDNYDSDSFDHYPANDWTIEGVIVVEEDEDGDAVEVELSDLIELLPDAFSSIDYSSLEIDQVQNVDADQEAQEVLDAEPRQAWAEHVVRADNAPDLKFHGKLISWARSSDNQAMGSSYSGSVGRWTELNLYQTKGGKYVCQCIGYTRWQGERDRYSAKVCDTVEEVREFFGHRWLAKELYEGAGIEDAETVE